jgi:hypothetical protein
MARSAFFCPRRTKKTKSSTCYPCPGGASFDRTFRGRSVPAVTKAARLLKVKAVASLRRAMQAFNSMDDDGRRTTVLLLTQHSFEMLLKAALAERRVPVFDPKTRRSIGFEKCLNLAIEHLHLDARSAGTLRTIDALRDDEQHYLGDDDEALLFVHVRAAVTIFDDLLASVFNEKLADQLPARVLPVSTLPPQDLDLLVDSQFSQAKDLLAPNLRRRAEARQKIRTLLALEGHTSDEVRISERDVDRVEQAIKSGKSKDEVFPRLVGLTTEVEGSGMSVVVRFSKKEGLPVRYIGADDPTDAAAVRDVDLQRKYHLSRSNLALALGLSTHQCKSLRLKLGIEDDPSCFHEFKFGKTTHPHYSDNALRKMKEALASEKAESAP